MYSPICLLWKSNVSSDFNMLECLLVRRLKDEVLNNERLVTKPYRLRL